MKTTKFSGKQGQNPGLATLTCEQLEARKAASAARVTSAQEHYNAARLALATALKPYGVSPDSEDILSVFTLKLAQAKNNVDAAEGQLAAFLQSPTMLAALQASQQGTKAARAKAQAVVVSKAEDAKPLILAVDQKRAAFAAAKEVAVSLPSLLGRVNNAKTFLVSAQDAHKANILALEKATKVAEAKAILAAPSDARINESADLLKKLLGLA